MTLLAFDPTARLRVSTGQTAFVEASIDLDPERGLVVVIEHDDGTQQTLVVPVDRVNLDALTASRRSAA